MSDFSSRDVGSAGRSVTMLVGPLGMGGIGRVVIQLTEALIASGVEVDLLVLGRESPFFSMLPKGANVVMLGSLHPLRGTFELARYLRRRKPEVVLNHRPRLIRQIRWAQSLVLVPFRLVNVIHTHLSAHLENGNASKRQLRAVRSLSASDALIATSQEVANDAANVLAWPSNEIYVAYPSIEVEGLKRRAVEKPSAPQLDKVPEEFLVAIGRLEAEKDFGTLIHAFALLAGARPALELVILGEGRSRPALESLVSQLGLSGRVHLAGFATNPYAWLARARGLVLSSIREGFGIVLAEALALGVPAVATDCPSGPREILAGGRYGHLVPVGDPAALADAIALALQSPLDPELAHAAVARFSPEVALREYLAALFPARHGVA